MALSLIIAPLFAILLVNILPKSWQRIILLFALVLALFQVSFTLLPNMYQDAGGGYLASFLAVDDITRVMLLAIAIVVGAAVLLIMAYEKLPEDSLLNMANLILIAQLGMNGLVMVQDIFSMYVFLEVAAISSFILIAVQKSEQGLEGSFKYLVMSVVATVMILLGIAILFSKAGTVRLLELTAIFKVEEKNALLLLGFALILTGALIKCGVIPFHTWVPDAYMSAPSPVSVLLAGIVTKTTGVYILIRVVLTLLPGGGESAFAALRAIGAITLVVAALIALVQSDFKRMLAYSSISQVGFILLAFGAGNQLGIAAAIFHIFNHAIFKSLLFVDAANVELKTGKTDMNAFGGLGAKMPVTSVTSLVGLLSTAGVPPLAGFWSKLFGIIALWQAGYIAYATVAILASLLTLAYFLSMERRVFFGKLSQECEKIDEVSLASSLPAILLMLITIGLGLAVPWIIGSFIMPALLIGS
jgi:multicomponent Na+:H+ antiporter subunit D